MRGASFAGNFLAYGTTETQKNNSLASATGKSGQRFFRGAAGGRAGLKRKEIPKKHRNSAGKNLASSIGRRKAQDATAGKRQAEINSRNQSAAVYYRKTRSGKDPQKSG